MYLSVRVFVRRLVNVIGGLGGGNGDDNLAVAMQCPAISASLLLSQILAELAVQNVESEVNFQPTWRPGMRTFDLEISLSMFSQVVMRLPRDFMVACIVDGLPSLAREGPLRDCVFRMI